MEPDVLIIEDDADLCEALAEALRSDGLNVITSDNSETGLAIVQKVRPKLILLDLFTHSIHGVHFIERLRAEKAIADTEIMVITNNENPKQKERAQKLGVLDYFIKARTPLFEIATAVQKRLATKD